jgi:uncharacterized protein with FMN-binding domain
MSRSRRVVLVLLAAALGLSIGGCGALEEIEALTVEDVPVSAVRDGDYAAAENYLPVTAKVRVSVRGGEITEIELVRHMHGPGHGADAIVERVLAAQSLRVDAVSGASYSSKVVLKAIETALKQGR